MVLCRASLRIVSAPNSLQFHVDPLPYRNGLFWRVPPSCQPVCRSADRGPLCRFVVYLRSCGDGSRGNDLRFVGDAGEGSRQNGRTSCRDRVCQYVEISVVAASLKKKQTTEKKQG